MKFKRWLTHNLGLKILSVFLSFFLWMYIYYVFGSRMTKNAIIQVQIKTVQTKYHVSLNPSKITIQYNGPMQLIEKAEKELRAVLDLPEDINPGTYQRKPVITSPKNIDIKKVEPEMIEVTIEHIVVEDFKIETNLVGKPKSGNIIGEIKLTPNAVSIEGPQSAVQSIKRVVIDLDVNDASSDIFGSAQIKVLNHENKEVENIELSERAIQFQIHVFTSDLTKTVPIIPQLVGLSTWMITKITLDPQVVTIQGSSSILDSISSITTEPIDISQLKGVLEKEISLDIPENIKVTDTTKKYKIRITSEEIITIQLKDIAIMILPTNTRKSVTLSEKTADLAITGKKSIVESIQKFQIFVNIENLTNGDHTVSLQVIQIPKECTVQIFPPKISLKIMD